MANYEPPTENLPIFDVTTFRNDNPYSDIYLARQGLATSVATETSFSGLVNFNNLVTPPHCSAIPVDPNDLANKAYVDALAPKTAYIVYLNYSQTFTTSTPTIYKKLNPLTNNTPTTVPLFTTNTIPQLIAGFFNTKADLKFANIIPTGDWTLVLFANCAVTADQNHFGLNFVLYGVTTLGVENIIATSASSPLINVLAPLIGTYSCVLTIPTAIDITLYDQVGIKVYVLSNTSTNRNGSILFQYPSTYSSLITSFATTQAADITVTNNTWTGTNTFNNTTNLNTTIIQGSGTIQFPDTSVQSTAFKAITSGIYTNSNITVDAQGAISSISNGVGGNTLTTVTMPVGTYYPTWTNSSTGASGLIPYTDGNMSFDQAANRLIVPNLRSFGQIELSNATPIITTVATNTDLILRTMAASTGSLLLKTQNTTRVSIASDGISSFLNQIKLISTVKEERQISNTFYNLLDNTDGVAGGTYRGRIYSTPTNTYLELNSGHVFSINFGSTVFEIYSSALNCYVPISSTGAISLTGSTGADRRLNASQIVLSSTTGGAGVGTAIGLLYGNGSDIIYDNDTLNGVHKFYTQSSIGQVISLIIGSASISTVVPVNVVTTVSASTPSMTIKSSSSSTQIINFTPSAPFGTFNPMAAGTGPNSILSCGTPDTNGRFVLTIDSATTIGIRMSTTAMIMGAGGTTGNPTNYLAFDPTSVVFSCNTTPPTIIGAYAIPAGSDSSTKIATTAWVQTAIPLATSALADNLTGGVIGNLLYQTSAGLTTRMPNSSSGFVLVSGGVGAVPNWQTGIAGNAGTASKILLTPYTGDPVPAYISFSTIDTGYASLRTTGNTNLNYNIATGTITGNISGSASSASSASLATQVILANTATGVTNYLVMSTTASGTSSLITDNSGATYDSANNIADINITANSGSTTNTAITNDVVSATNHAITFTSNTTGNLPQKTRADVSTGAGLTYVPSTNTLTVSAAGVGTVSSGTFTLKNASANQCDITNSSGSMNISNKLASSSILLQTANASSVLSTQVMVSVADTEIINKLQVSAGIIGPSAILTYTSDMIGYSFSTNDTAVTFTVATSTLNCPTFPAIGIWLMNGAQIFQRGTGTYNVASNTIMTITVSGGGTYAGTNLYSPIPNGATLTTLTFPITPAIITCTTVGAFVQVASTTTMLAYGTATRLIRCAFVRIA
jgi:hypothetical protein